MSIFSIGLSGLHAAQTALHATSGNISNVYTPGYNREVALLGENNGNGVKVNDVQRQFDQFVATRLNAASGSLASLEAYSTQLKQIDNLLSDDAAGLSPLMQKFFGAVSQMAGNPGDPAARQGVLGTASTMVSQFQSFGNYLGDIGRGVNQQISDEVIGINTLTSQIAQLNNEIQLARGSNGAAPNSLLNQRDNMVHQLSQQIDIRVNEQDSGSYTISLGNGLPLVAGGTQYELRAGGGQADPTRTMVSYVDGSGNQRELSEVQFKRGKLSGLFEFRRESLDKMQNQLGQLAYSLATAFNEVHQQGVDLNRQPGGALFGIGEPAVFSNSRNTGGVTAAVAITDTSALAATGFDVRHGETGYTVTRRDTGKAVDATFDAGANTLSFAGVQLTFSGTPAMGDQFRVEPLNNVVSQFELLISEGSEIAAAQSNNSGDNRNALALLDLQNQQLVQGKASFNQAYAGMISTAGNQMSVVQANLAAQQGLTDQLSVLQQSESGVNLDEEAANLVRYQQYYQANAKVIETGSTILDTILSLR